MTYKSLLMSALCAFFMSGVFAGDQQTPADKAKELIKQDREAAKEIKKDAATQYIIKLLTR